MTAIGTKFIQFDTLQNFHFCKAMIVTITSKRQVTFPKQVMDKLHLHTGDKLSISDTEDGILIKPHRFDAASFAPLKDKINPLPGKPDYDDIRHAALSKDLRS